MSELGDLLELLYGARERWRTARLTVRDWSHRERARAAFDRRVSTLEVRGAMMQIPFAAPGAAEPRPETQESCARLWLDGDRSRLELELERGDGTTVVVHDGGTWWMTSPGQSPLTNAGDPHHHAGSGGDIVQMLDPSALSAAFELEPLGAREVAGRPGIAVRAVPRPIEHHLPFFWQLLGADEVELVVDTERGTVLRTEAFIDGEPYHVTELTGAAFDETFPDATFRLELPPGQSFEPAGGHRPESLTLDQAARRASFPLFIPARPGAGWRLAHAAHFPSSERPLVLEAVHLTYRHEAGAHEFRLAESTEPHPWLGSADLTTVERGGLVMKILDPDEEDFPGPRHVLVEHDGTHVNLSSQDLSLEQLIEVAASLVRAPDSPPPAVER